MRAEVRPFQAAELNRPDVVEEDPGPPWRRAEGGAAELFLVPASRHMSGEIRTGAAGTGPGVSCVCRLLRIKLRLEREAGCWRTAVKMQGDDHPRVSIGDERELGEWAATAA